MKSLIFVLICLLMISSATALSIGSIRYFDDIFLVNVHNDGLDDLEELKVKVRVVEDMDVYRSRSFDLDVNENKGTYVIIDEPIEEQLVKLTVRNDAGERRVKYLII